MDRKLQKQLEIQALIETSHSARSYLDSEAKRVRKCLDLPAQIQSKLAGHKSTLLLVGSVLSGLAVSVLFRGKTKSSTSKKGIASSLLRMTWKAATPFVKGWLAHQIKSYALNYLTQKYAAQNSTPVTHVSSSGPRSR
jgi:hypothetical protein